MGICLPGSAPRQPTVLVVGAGVAGLSAAAVLAQAGLTVQVLEAAAVPGGKMAQVQVGGQSFDAGPTVLTMRWVFDEWFDSLGLSLDSQLTLQRCQVLARHAWSRHERLDLLASLDDSVDAIAAFSGGDQAGLYRAFCRRAREVYQTLEAPFLRQTRPATPLALAWRCGWRQLPALARISPFASLWQALGRYFPDPRLHQLFGRYATYCGSSPFEAPATLMLVAHVEREGVWRVDGGMQALSQAMADAARQQGVAIRCSTPVSEVLLGSQGVRGVRLADGEELHADIVVFNGDVAALRSGALGEAVQRALWPGRGRQTAPETSKRSLSALTWHLSAATSGFDLSHHNVFFSDPRDGGYRAEFDTIAQGQLPAQPTCTCARRTGRRRCRAAPPMPDETAVLLQND